MYEQLKFMLEVFEKRVDKLEEEYKEKNKDNFSEEKMNRHINRKLKREIQIINYCNIAPSLHVLNSENFKY